MPALVSHTNPYPTYAQPSGAAGFGPSVTSTGASSSFTGAINFAPPTPPKTTAVANGGTSTGSKGSNRFLVALMVGAAAYLILRSS